MSFFVKVFYVCTEVTLLQRRSQVWIPKYHKVCWSIIYFFLGVRTQCLPNRLRCESVLFLTDYDVELRRGPIGILHHHLLQEHSVTKPSLYESTGETYNPLYRTIRSIPIHIILLTTFFQSDSFGGVLCLFSLNYFKLHLRIHTRILLFVFHTSRNKELRHG